LAIIDRTMKAVSGISDPEKMVQTYWDGIGDLLPFEDYIALSRRGVEPPDYIITRSSRFVEHFNPWTEREKLPRMSGGVLGRIAYAEEPVVIEDLPSILTKDDPGHFYLEGFEGLIASPQYDDGRALNIGISLWKPGVEFDRTVIPMMHWQAGLFGRGTQNLVLKNQLGSALAELDRELQVVGEIQRALLPRELPKIPGIEMDTLYRTSARAGGDYYDFFPLTERSWGIFIADVAGHGTPAAVLMAITHAIAHTRPGPPTPPDDVLEYLNHHLARSYTTSGSFVTAFYATLDIDTRELVYSTAGHNPPRLLRRGEVLSLGAGETSHASGLPLGILEDSVYGRASMKLEKDDLLVLYTDGITEAMARADANGRRTLYGLPRLDALLQACPSASAEACIKRISEDVMTFTQGTPPTDDQTLVAIRCVG
jgi:sigma-B regulation protein RsbU (phosphoserine phosphatase)